MIRLSKALLIAAGSIATTGVALAQDDSPEEAAPPEGEPASPPEESAEPEPARAPAGPPLTLYKGKILIAGSTVNINLSADSVAEPISLAPSVWYGVDDKLTLGLTHDFGSTPWTPRPAFRSITVPDGLGGSITAVAGAGICLTGEEGGCNRPYDNVSAEGLYSLKNERLSLAAHPGLDIVSFDPFALAVRLGVLGRYLVNDKLSLVFDPRLRFGITERDAGNKEFIDLPIWVWYAVNDKISAYLHTGLNSAFEEFGDSVSIPLQIGGNYMVSPKLTAGLDFGFTKLNDGADGRVLGLRIAYAL